MKQLFLLGLVLFTQRLLSVEFELPPDMITIVLENYHKSKLLDVKQGQSITVEDNKTFKNNDTTDVSLRLGDFQTVTDDPCDDDCCCQCDDCTDDVQNSALSYEYAVPPIDINDGDKCIVFSWQSITNVKSDGRWGRSTVGTGNEFRVAVKSIRDSHPSLPIFLFTNIQASNIDADIRKNITVVEVDLMSEANLYDLLHSTKDSKVGFGTKPQSLITGWEKGILPNYVLYLDIDIIIAKNTPEFNLDTIFEPLKVNL